MQHQQLSSPASVFCVAAPSDSDAKLLREWEGHLRLLEQARLITIWSDQHIVPGTPLEQIHEHLDHSDLIVLLLSADFFGHVECIELMERAATKCFEWLEANGYSKKDLFIFCGKGNNGGDGLAIARMLANKGSQVVVYILEFGHKGTEDFQANLERLHQIRTDIRFIQAEENFPAFTENEIIIDALFGSGLNRPLE